MAANDVVNNVQRFPKGIPAKATLNDKLAFATHCIQNYRVPHWLVAVTRYQSTLRTTLDDS